MLAIVESLKSFKYYLFGRKFTIRCDNAALTKLSKLESPSNRITRWFAYLSEFNYEFELIKSEENHVADILSRDFHVNNIQIDLPTLTDVQTAQYSDPKLIQIISELETNPGPHKKSYFLKDGLLMHTAYIPRSGRSKRIQQIVIPDKYKPHILAAKHLPHFGHLKTYDAIREKYFWEGLYSDARNYVDSCRQCIQFKSPNKIPPVPIQRHYIPSRPMEYVSCDYIGKLPQTRHGNCYILTFIDHFTKYIKLYAVSDQTAKTTADKLLEYACIFGFPEYLLSDKGSGFIAQITQDLCKRLGVIKLKTTSLNPRSNGQSERINVNIKRCLSIFATETQDWDEFINYYELLYNSSVHSSTGEKPSYLHLSYDPNLPTDIIQNEQPSSPPSYDDYVKNKTNQLQYTFNKVRENLIKMAETQENYQHKFAKYRDFYPGQLVYMYSPDSDRNSNLPKRRNYVGPMRILQIHNRVLCTIIDVYNVKAKPIKVHTQRLIPYTERKRELDYIYKLVQQQKTEDENHTNAFRNFSGSETLQKPHATFDDFSDSDLLTHIHSNSSPLLQEEVSSHSPYSGKTEIYTVENDISPVTTNQREPAPSHSYNLRSRSENTATLLPTETLPNRLFNWSLAMTESNNSTPKPIKFLQKISKALD